MTDDPEWLNPANDRKTPYTDEELEEFVESFIGRHSILYAPKYLAFQIFTDAT